VKAATRKGLFLALALAYAANLAAQIQPETEPGKRPGLAYRTDGIDDTNLFNGNVNLTIPLGSYHVNGGLSYSLDLHHSSSPWLSETHQVDLLWDNSLHTVTYSFWYPNPSMNAGLGWRLSLGSMDPTGAYVSPDGATHGFSTSLHEFDANEIRDVDVSYSRDGTYLRRTRLHSGPTLTGWKVEFPDGDVETFDGLGRLKRREDKFGNFVEIHYRLRQEFPQYNTDPSMALNSVWEIHDSAGRNHYIVFRPGWPFVEDIEDFEAPSERQHELVDFVDLRSFGPASSTEAWSRYTFAYDVLPRPITPANQNDPSLKTSRRCSNVPDPHLPKYARVSLLTSISMPEGVTYSIVTDRGDHTSCSDPALAGISGNVTRLTLPTGSTIDWTFTPYRFPGRIDTSFFNAGVATRTLRDRADGNLVSTIEYVPTLDTEAQFPFSTRLVRTKDENGNIVNETKHYFSSCRPTCIGGPGGPFGGGDPGTCRPCATGLEYALPYNRNSPVGAGFLSTEVWAADENNHLPQTATRTTALRYEADITFPSLNSFTDPQSVNQRVCYERTSSGSEYTDLTRSEFDGLGHYRREVMSGNLQANSITVPASGYNPTGTQRAVVTNYNPAAGVFQIDANSSVYGFSMLQPTNPTWLLTLYDKQLVTESLTTQPNSSTAQETTTRISLCFDPQSGFVTRRRIHKNGGENPANSPDDLLAVFTNDSHGNVASERYFGGDSSASSAVRPATIGGCTDTNLGVATFRIDHTYDVGAEKSSTYVDDATQVAAPYYLVDNEIDGSGFIRSATRFRKVGQPSGGISTTFAYDQLGRVTEVSSPRMKTAYTYAIQSPAGQSPGGATISVTDKKASGVVIRSSQMSFDAMGRLTREARSMPSGTGERRTEYDGLGRKRAIYDWGAAKPTILKYDGLNRTTTVMPPDQVDAVTPKSSTTTYTGLSSLERSSWVRTGGTVETPVLSEAKTKELYDSLGRLSSVTEPPPQVNGTRPVTEYRYDSGGRLAVVCANVSSGTCGQLRTFNYDPRGLLTSESHPESASTTYQYDSRGHAVRRRTGTSHAFDVSLAYDAYERLRTVSQIVSESGSTRDEKTIKQFTYFADNDGTSMSLGLLQQAVRHNWFRFPGESNDHNDQVVETYAYDGNGNVASRFTKDYLCEVTSGNDCETLPLSSVPATHEFAQAFTYDELDSPAALTYPACVNLAACQGAIAARVVTNTYSNGFLTAVGTTNGAGGSLTYAPSGLVSVAHHGNDVEDVVTPDPAVPGRPAAITVQNLVEAGSCVAPSFQIQPQSNSIQSGQWPGLVALATGENGHAITYRWYRGTAPSEATPIGSSSSSPAFPGAELPSVTTSYWVKASSDCGSKASNTATVTVCATPVITSIYSEDVTITRGGLGAMAVDVAGVGPFSYQWFVIDGTQLVSLAGPAQAIQGQGGARIWLNLSPVETTSYRLKVTNACGESTHDFSITVVDPPIPPHQLTASFLGGNSVLVKWKVADSQIGIYEYRLFRYPGNWGQGLRVVSTPCPGEGDPDLVCYTDATAVPGKSYFYRVLATDNNGSDSSFSNADLATLLTFSEDPLAAPNQNPVIKAVHISELRRAVDEAREAAGLYRKWPSPYLPPVGQEATTFDFSALRDGLNEARSVYSLPLISIDGSIAKALPVRAQSIIDIRNGVK
jgi:YD repeat-containing protein